MDNEDGAKYISKKSDSIKNMFRSISGYYDFLNRLLSLGIDRSWRNKAAITLKDLEDKSLLDLACGTADLAIAIAEVHQSVKIVGIDFVDEMISIGKKKIEKLKLTDQIKLEVGDALNLKYDDDTFDAVTIGFGVRNFADLERGLGEIVRVTKPGGQILILEFSQPENKILKALYNFYFTKILPL
ncbi:MAG: ubiquinone/menaquinone biosynthesis methyltransferase, partial [Nitrospinota bacterium]